MGEIDNRRLQGDTPLGAYLTTLDSLVEEHDRRERLTGSYFELANRGGPAGQEPEELLNEIGRVADMADPVPAGVTARVKDAGSELVKLHIIERSCLDELEGLDSRARKVRDTLERIRDRIGELEPSHEVASKRVIQ